MKLSYIERVEFGRYMDKHDFGEALRGKTLLMTGSRGIVGTGITKWLLLENERHGLGIHIIGSTRRPDVAPEWYEDGDPVSWCAFGDEAEAAKGAGGVDVLVHAASSTDNAFHKAHPVESFRVNFDGTERMLEIARDNPGSSMLYLSSEEVYGLPDDDVPALGEDAVGAIDSLTLRSCYPLSKKASEYLCYASSVEYGTDVKIARPTVIHGLLQKWDDPRVVNEIMRCVVRGEDLVMRSDGLTKKCLCYSLDVIAALLTVLVKGTAGEAYNISNPSTFMTVRDLASHVFDVFAPELRVVYADNRDSVEAGYLPHRTLVQDISKIRTLGWEPMTDLDHIYEVDIERFREGC